MVQVTTIYGADPILCEIKHTVTALPFTDKVRAVPYVNRDSDGDNDDGDDRERREDEVDDDEAVGVSTRARLAYDLEGYAKNAMLIVNAETKYSLQQDRLGNIVPLITEAFQKFKFEVETFVGATEAEIEAKCQEFSQRDFTDYGCIGVVMLTLDGVEIDDSIVVRHWTVDNNPTLQKKPKIYINEVELASGFRRVQSECDYRVPITGEHADVLCFRIPTINHIDLFPQPMKVFCDKISAGADVDDMMTTIVKSIHKMEGVFRTRVLVASTLEKKLFLSRIRHE